MATNGLLIEFGSNKIMDDEELKHIQGIIAQLSKLKSDKSIEEFRLYPIVTGNRSQRVAMMMLEMSHQQLEAFVVSKPYGELMRTLMKSSTNVTINRAITSERMLELVKQVM